MNSITKHRESNTRCLRDTSSSGNDVDHAFNKLIMAIFYTPNQSSELRHGIGDNYFVLFQLEMIFGNGSVSLKSFHLLNRYCWSFKINFFNLYVPFYLIERREDVLSRTDYPKTLLFKRLLKDVLQFWTLVESFYMPCFSRRLRQCLRKGAESYVFYLASVYMYGLSVYGDRFEPLQWSENLFSYCMLRSKRRLPVFLRSLRMFGHYAWLSDLMKRQFFESLCICGQVDLMKEYINWNDFYFHPLALWRALEYENLELVEYLTSSDVFSRLYFNSREGFLYLDKDTWFNKFYGQITLYDNCIGFLKLLLTRKVIYDTGVVHDMFPIPTNTYFVSRARYLRYWNCVSLACSSGFRFTRSDLIRYSYWFDKKMASVFDRLEVLVSVYEDVCMIRDEIKYKSPYFVGLARRAIFDIPSGDIILGYLVNGTFPYRFDINMMV